MPFALLLRPDRTNSHQFFDQEFGLNYKTRGFLLQDDSGMNSVNGFCKKTRTHNLCNYYDARPFFCWFEWITRKRLVNFPDSAYDSAEHLWILTNEIVFRLTWRYPRLNEPNWTTNKDPDQIATIRHASSRSEGGRRWVVAPSILIFNRKFFPY